MKQCLLTSGCSHLILIFGMCNIITSCISGLETQLENGIQDAYNSNADFKMVDVTPFEWDRLYVFPPYTSHEDIRTTLGTAKDELTTSIDLLDTINLLVFVKDDEVVAFLDFPVEKGDFKKMANFTPEESVFEVLDSGYGTLLLKAMKDNR